MFTIIKPQFDRLTYLGRKTKLFAAKGPMFHYTYGRWRLRRWLDREQVNVAVMDDATFFSHLDLENPALKTVEQSRAKGDYEAAKTNLLSYFQTRLTPTCFFEQDEIAQLLSRIDPAQREASINNAEQICQNIFNFRQAAPVVFENGIDWGHRPQGNIDWTWDLNRHAYFETLGRAYRYTNDERYANKFRELLGDWLANNPVGVRQSNWSSVFEVAFRVNVWIWAFFYFRAAIAFDAQTCLTLLKGLLAHGQYLNTHLELHVQNNHLLLEAKSLAMLGILFPEFKQATEWRQLGQKTLYKEVRNQVCSDGVHGERATLYHRIIAGELLEFLTLLENNKVTTPQDIVEIFSRMVEFELWITKPNGQVPLLGDSALEDTYLRFPAAKGGPVFLGQTKFRSIVLPLDEANIWLLGEQRIKQYLASPEKTFCFNSRAFPEGGYFVMRQGHNLNATYLLFDCGPFGYKPVPSHGHADALSFELAAHGQTFLVDPGVYSTRLGHNWRNFFRGSRAHNTVVVDNQDQSELVDIWRVDRAAQIKLHKWISSEHFDFVDGSHNGYERLSEPITHRRQIFFVKPEYWVIIDSLTGQGKHCFDFYFHLMPNLDAQLNPNSGAVWAKGEDESGLVITPLSSHNFQADLINGSTEPIQGWVSFHSGQKQPAPALRYRQEAIAPLQFCTVLYPYSAPGNISVTATPLDVKVNHHHQPVVQNKVTGLRIQTDTHVDYLVVDRETEKRDKAFAGYQTNAQLVYIRCEKDVAAPVKVVVRDGDQLLFQEQSLLDMHHSREDFILDYQATG